MHPSICQLCCQTSSPEEVATLSDIDLKGKKFRLEELPEISHIIQNGEKPQVGVNFLLLSDYE